ncbi:hypothetical protein GCM10012275_40600 [Longimycelium tulufanense]|uniref:Uncharacterized protein n=1 Tax=Longimycelium tulufanense TaxID=907463 RepID=A0A8J3CGZ2_9PSEU|nr:hypothetical protein [Longimycelium tulufanense]GGM65850.1 hypothetical protein GCM10012275_40600 [Longimycelium tulufanense]
MRPASRGALATLLALSVVLVPAYPGAAAAGRADTPVARPEPTTTVSTPDDTPGQDGREKDRLWLGFVAAALFATVIYGRRVRAKHRSS